MDAPSVVLKLGERRARDVVDVTALLTRPLKARRQQFHCVDEGELGRVNTTSCCHIQLQLRVPALGGTTPWSNT